MKIDTVKNYNPQFTARCTFHGDLNALSVDELRKIIMTCREIGTKKDWYDIYIPYVKEYTNGLLPIAEYVNKNLQVIFGEYKNGKVYPTIINCLRNSKKKFIRLENNKTVTSNNRKVTIRGNLDALTREQRSIAVRGFLNLGSERDKYDMYLPQPKHQYSGLIPIAVFVRGKAIATFGAYKNDDVFYGVLNGIKNIRNNIVKQPNTKNLNPQK